MNNVQLIGRLTKDGEVTSTTSGTTIYKNSIAVDRKGSDDKTDFISIVAFSKTAEFLEKYFHKGDRIGISGRIQTGDYTNKDGKKVYTFDVVVDSADFCESKSSGGVVTPSKTPDNDFLNVDDINDLPFN